MIIGAPLAHCPRLVKEAGQSPLVLLPKYVLKKKVFFQHNEETCFILYVLSLSFPTCLWLAAFWMKISYLSDGSSVSCSQDTLREPFHGLERTTHGNRVGSAWSGEISVRRIFFLNNNKYKKI